MSDTASSSVSAVHAPRIDLFRDRLDGGVEHHVAQLHGGERIVATLGLHPVRTAPLRTLSRIGAATLPDTEGAYATMSADADASGEAGLTLATLAALALRRREADDLFWLAACPAPLVPDAIALGWRPVPRSADETACADTPLVLLVDDLEHLEAVGSPLAAVPPRPRSPRIAPALLLDALGLPACARACAGASRRDRA